MIKGHKLPWQFVNTGRLTNNLSHSLVCPSIQLRFTEISNPLRVKGKIKYIAGNSMDIKDELNMYGCRTEALQKILDNKDEQLVFHAVTISEKQLNLCFRDRNQPRGKKDKPVNSIITIDQLEFVRAEIYAPKFDINPAHRLFLQYGHDVVWGKFIKIVDWVDGQGATEAGFWPDLPEDRLRDFIEKYAKI